MARLLDVLRGELRLTGTKEGCGEGECGACSVLVDGAARQQLPHAAAARRGTSITTIEGVATGERLHAVQEAFIAHGGAQCGICTPGMVLAAVELLERTPEPTPTRSATRSPATCAAAPATCASSRPCSRRAEVRREVVSCRSSTCARPRTSPTRSRRSRSEPGQWRPFAGGTDLMVLLEAGKLPPGRYLSLWGLAASSAASRSQTTRSCSAR